MIHQNLSHSAAGNSKEMNAVLNLQPPLFGKAQVEFVNERGGLQGVALRLP